MAATTKGAGADVGKVSHYLRAPTEDAKDKVRKRLIACGRELFTTVAHEDVTMRKLAEYGGFSTGLVYHYFASADALFDAIRDAELLETETALLAAIEGVDDPLMRLKSYVAFTRSYTMRVLDLFGSRFLSGAPHQSESAGASLPSTAHFDPSLAAGRIHALCDNLLRDFFDTLPCHPLPIHIAADSLIGAINSNLIMAGASHYRRWADPVEVGDAIFDALICYWRSLAHELAGKEPQLP